AGLLRRVELEPFEQLGPAPAVGGPAFVPGEDVDRLAPGELRPQAGVAGHVGESAVDGDGVAPRVPAEHLGGAGVGAEHAEEDADRRRLARAVRPEEAGDLTGRDREGEPVERTGGAEGLREVAGADGGLRHEVSWVRVWAADPRGRPGRRRAGSGR